MDRAIRFHLNGEPVVASGLSPTTTLLNYLRDTQQLVGTKEGCAEGDCGACTVVLVDRNGATGPSFRAVNACLVLLPLVHGQQVITVEALRGDSYHPVQEALVAYLGSQCGYCTPGVIMSMFEACYRRDLDAGWKLDDQMCGNLCRCTGYRPIREATQAIAGTCPKDRFLKVLEQPPTPPAGLDYRAGDQEFMIPTTWEQLFEALSTRPQARLICGATDLGLDVTKKHTAFASLISLQALPELAKIEVSEEGLRIGATVNLADLEHVCAEACPPVTRILRYFGARQIKNRATIGGNLCNASPIGDLAPVLLALEATLVVRGSKGAREVPISEFFTGYRQTVLQPGEILARIDIPKV
ncbi:MAG: FAD binding domain-containing protein, partial [Nannocystaceae bacterium]